MDRRIYVDIGNSRIKVSLWREGRFDPKIVYLNSVSDFSKWYDDHRLGNEEIILASVVKSKVDEFKQLVNQDMIVQLDVSQIPSSWLDYKTADTLGIDRFLTCLGASSKSNSSVIVIDTGTACTIDYMDKEKVFRGGVIMPGLSTIHKAVQVNIPELPHVDESIPNDFPGKSSEEAVKWGTNGVMKYSVEQFINQIKAGDKNAQVYITGGDAMALSKLIDLDHSLEGKLLFEGMKLFCDLFVD